MGEEIELEALAQHRVRRPRRCGPARRRRHSRRRCRRRRTARRRGRTRRAPPPASVTSQPMPSPPSLCRRRLGLGRRRGRAARSPRPRARSARAVGETDRAGAAGDHRDLAGQRLFDCAAELGLFRATSIPSRTIRPRSATRSVPTASASVTVSTQLSAMSAATAASLALRPSPNRPSPGTRITRGIGSSSRFVPPSRVVAGEIGVVVGDECARPPRAPPRRIRRACPASGGGTISG